MCCATSTIVVRRARRHPPRIADTQIWSTSIYSRQLLTPRAHPINSLAPLIFESHSPVSLSINEMIPSAPKKNIAGADLCDDGQSCNSPGKHARGGTARIAEARHAKGLGSQRERADAQSAIATAESDLIQAGFPLATA